MNEYMFMNISAVGFTALFVAGIYKEYQKSPVSAFKEFAIATIFMIASAVMWNHVGWPGYLAADIVAVYMSAIVMFVATILACAVATMAIGTVILSVFLVIETIREKLQKN